MTLPTGVSSGEINHISHHNTLHTRYNNSVDILSDVIASRPGAGTVDAGTLFWATDEAKFYRSDGAATWTQLTAGASAHGDLTGVTADQHHTEDHAARHATGQADALAPGDIGAAPASQGVTNGDSHDHSGGDGAQIAHSSLSGVTADAHHNESHAARHAENGADELDVASLGSGAVASGLVATADGAGGVDWLAAGGGGTLAHNPAFANVNVNSTTDVTVDSSTHTITDGDVIRYDISGFLYQNSASSRIITYTLNVGPLSFTGSASVSTSSAYYPMRFVVLGHMGSSQCRGIVIVTYFSNAQSQGALLGTATHSGGWHNPASSGTGSQDVEFLIRSNSTSATQQFYVSSALVDILPQT